MLAISEGLIKAIPQLITAVPEIITNLVNAFWNNRDKILDIGVNIVKGVWDGISSMAGWLFDKVSGFFDGLFGGVEEEEEIHSPSKKWARGIGRPMAQGIGVGFEDAMRDVNDMISSAVSSVRVSPTQSSGSTVSAGTIVNQYIQAVPMTPNELARQSVDAFDRLRWAY